MNSSCRTHKSCMHANISNFHKNIHSNLKEFSGTVTADVFPRTWTSYYLFCKSLEGKNYRECWKKTPQTIMMISWSWWNTWIKSVHLPIHFLPFFLSFISFFYYSMGSSRKAPFWHWDLTHKSKKVRWARDLYHFIIDNMDGRKIESEWSNCFSPNVLVLQQDRPVFFLFFNLQRQTVRVFSLLTIYHRIVGE